MRHARIMSSAAVAVAVATVIGARELPRHIVLFIGDGMGEGQVAATRAWLGRPLAFERFPISVLLSTESAGGGITDSAAASTAIATGYRVANGVISRAIPGDGADLPTLGALFHAAGRRVGLITTSYLLDATPAAFVSHATTRADHAAILRGYLAANGPRLLLGGGAGDWSLSDLAEAGFTVATTVAEMWAAATSRVARLAGLFGSGAIPYEYDGLNGAPGIEEMTRAALEYLVDENSSTFVMIEGGRIDHAAHANDLPRCIGEMVAFERAVSTVLSWASNRSDVLIVVAADHETGGLRVLEDRGPGVLPLAVWSTRWHTAAFIRAYAYGVGADRLLGVHHLTDLHGLLNNPTFPAPRFYRTVVDPGRHIELEWLAISGRVYEVEAISSLALFPWFPCAAVTARHSGRLETRIQWPESMRQPIFFRVVQRE